jgi:hypothetical protein
MRELEDLVLEIMEDPIFKGNQNFKFEMDLDELVRRFFGGEAYAGVAFQIGRLRRCRRCHVMYTITIQPIVLSLSLQQGR